MYDSVTGLVRFGARDYDPKTGRWTAKDAILFAGGDTNLYSYVFNSPLDRIDPGGLTPQPSGSENSGPPADLTPAEGGDPVARIIRLKGSEGKVFVERANGSIESAFIGQKLFVGDHVVTDALSYAVFEFDTGGHIGVNKETDACITDIDRAEVDRSQETWLDSLKRQLSSPEAPPVELRSSSGVMGIRG